MFKKIYKLWRQKLWLEHRDFLIEKHELNYLFWECTLNCNFKCKHCWSRAWNEIFNNELTTEEIKNAFLDISKNFNAKNITIAVTGWEPLLRKDLFEVMKYAKSLWFSWWMVSNWFLVNENIVKKAKESWMSTIDISIDWTEEIHDNFRNMRWSYQKSINAINLYLNEKFLNSLRITTTVHSKNIDLLDEMYENFLRLWITKWRLLSVDPIWRANENNDILLNKKEYIKLLNYIKEKRAEKWKINVTYWCAHFLWDKYEDEVRGNFFYCATWINIGSILHNWDIFVCPNVPRKGNLIQWNIKTDSFSEVWKNKFNFFRDKNRTSCDKCKKCDNFNECKGWSLHTWNFEKNQPNVCFMDEKLYLD